MATESSTKASQRPSARSSQRPSQRSSAGSDEVAKLQAEVDHLMKEVERYRSAAEDALQQLDWCIGYFAGARKGDLARALSTNRSHIRREYLRRDDQSTPSSKDQ